MLISTKKHNYILDIDDFDPSQTGYIKITESSFKDLAEELLNKIRNTIISTLYHSNYKAYEIDRVLQLGGGCRMPVIKQLLSDTFPDAEQCCEEHPDEVVAIGAAYYAYNIFQSN